jgi:hypothetical protein
MCLAQKQLDCCGKRINLVSESNFLACAPLRVQREITSCRTAVRGLIYQEIQFCRRLAATPATPLSSGNFSTSARRQRPIVGDPGIYEGVNSFVVGHVSYSWSCNSCVVSLSAFLVIFQDFNEALMSVVTGIYQDFQQFSSSAVAALAYSCYTASPTMAVSRRRFQHLSGPPADVERSWRLQGASTTLSSAVLAPVARPTELCLRLFSSARAPICQGINSFVVPAALAES